MHALMYVYGPFFHLFTFSFIHSFKKNYIEHLLAPGMRLSTGDKEVNKILKVPAFQELIF